MARRERIIMLEPFGKGIMGTLLLYPYEIRGEEGVFEEIPVVNLMEALRKSVESEGGKGKGKEADRGTRSHQAASQGLMPARQPGSVRRRIAFDKRDLARQAFKS